MRSTLSMKDNLRLLAGNVRYHGPTCLVELDVTNVSIRSEGSDHVFVEIKLKRHCLFHLATTYFPTLCLFLLSETLLFINDEHYEATIMVSLTAMLVIYTLHQSILAHLPQTSYMKMIDIWLLCGLTIPFLVFILEVSSEILRHHKKQQKKVQKRSSFFQKRSSDRNIQEDLEHTLPTKVDSMPLVQNRIRGKVMPTEAGSSGGINNEAQAIFEVYKGPQADKTECKMPKPTLGGVDKRDASTDRYNWLEKLINTYMKAAIPLMTAVFIIGYSITAVTYYVY